MIDLFSEDVVSLTEAAKFVPRRRAGKKAHPSTLFRWAKDGMRGRKLETIRVGGTICTSREALARFFEALTRDAQGSDGVAAESRPAVPTVRSASERRRAIERAERELAALGV